MKNIYIVILLFVAFGCSKERPFHPSREELIGRKYLHSFSFVEFISADSLIWQTDILRDDRTSYRVKYSFVNDTVMFQVKDTLRFDFTDSFGNKSFTISCFHDSFKGTFEAEDILSTEVGCSREVWVEDKYITSSSSISITPNFYTAEY